ncbi:MAG TPA: ATP-binding cassette domain-containing protein [Candidatus Kapabacteria bacterium]|nr:ATP-binding cassette domain-containing protein [Candidatus Kapabacteria bacterium]
MTRGNIIVSVEKVSKSFGALEVLRDVSLTVREGETLAVLGKSGVGKSVLLKVIVGLLQCDSGEVYFEGKPISVMTDKELFGMRKQIGFLFQGGALFDSMTVGENLNLVLSRHTTLSLQEREARITKALGLVGLGEKIDEMPAMLSGGQRKRAGLARSIVLQPKLILYDEPTTGLDPITASSIAELILDLQQELRVASIVVTHDLPTTYTVSDRVMVLQAGKAIFDGPIEDIKTSNQEHLIEFLRSANLDRTRRDQILHIA